MKASHGNSLITNTHYRKAKQLCEQNQESREGTKNLGKQWIRESFLWSTDGL